MKTRPFLVISGVLIFMTLTLTSNAQGVKIGDNPSVQDPSAILELESSNLGLLITRVSLADIWDVATIPDPADGLLVYNTNFGGGSDPVSPGFYYWREDQGKWLRLQTGTGGSGGDIWIDANNNILSMNSFNQNLPGTGSVVLGEDAFNDDNGASNNVIAIGSHAAQSDTTQGDAHVIAIGSNAGMNNGGNYLVAVGMEAGMQNNAPNLIALGSWAGYQNHGFNVVAIGQDAGNSNTAENLNLIGPGAGFNNTGREINALGLEPAYNNTGLFVNALGSYTGYNNHGDHVNALGLQAAYNNTGSLVNVFGGAAGENNHGWSVNALGNQACQFNEGNDVNAMGAMAADYNNTACVNAFGLQAARFNSGYGTNAFGFQAALYNNGEHAVAIGDQALVGEEFVFEGAGNIGIGYHAGNNVNTGFRNICLGYDTQIPNPFADDQINIGNNILRESSGMIRMKDFIRLTPLEEPPAGAEEGSVYYDNALQKLRVLTSSGWEDLN